MRADNEKIHLYSQNICYYIFTFLIGGNFWGSQSPRGTRLCGQGRASFGTIDVGRLDQKNPEGPYFYCNKEGHWKRDCFKRKADEAGGKTKEQEGGHTAFVALGTKTTTSNDWIVDSGASQHLSAQREWFTNHQPITTIKIQIGDGSEIEAIGKGDMVLTIVTTEKKLHNVLHVPAIGSNLLSVAKIVDHGHSLFFSPSGCQIRNDNGLCIEGIREGNVYLLKTENQVLRALSNKDSAAMTEVWHRRIGHRSFDPIAQGRIQKGVTGLEVKHGNLMVVKGILE